MPDDGERTVTRGAPGRAIFPAAYARRRREDDNRRGSCHGIRRLAYCPCLRLAATMARERERVRGGDDIIAMGEGMVWEI
jgi:hypothetical protein